MLTIFICDFRTARAPSSAGDAAAASAAADASPAAVAGRPVGRRRG